MAFPKIMEHPDKNRIVKWLAEGKGVRKVSKMLREMYPNDRKRWLSIPTLQAFRKEHMKIEGDVLEELKKAAKQHAQDKELQKVAKDLKKEHTQVKNLASYKDKMAEIVDIHIDIKRGLVGMEKLITARLEELFDAAQRGEATIDREKLLQGYFDRYFIMIDKWAKYVDKVADFKVEANINVTVIQDQMSVLRQTIHELLQEMDPELAVGFLDRLNAKMRNLTYRPNTTPLADIRNEVIALPEAKVVSEEFDAD